MWLSKKDKTWTCVTCQHVLTGHPSKTMNDGFHEGRSDFCFPCAPPYDRVVSPLMYGLGETRFYKDDVECDSSGTIKCYECNVNIQTSELLSKQVRELKLEVKKLKKKKNAK